MPNGMEPKASVQLVAQRPGGELVPVIWIYQANPEFQQIYYFNHDIALPPGSKLEVIPPGSGGFALYWKPAKALTSAR